MSEQAAVPTGGEQGSLDSGTSRAADVPVSEPAMSEPSLTEPSLTEPSSTDLLASEPPKVEAVRPEVDASASRPQAASENIPHAPGKVILMSRGDHGWSDAGNHSGPEAQEQSGAASGKPRIAAMAAVLALATIAGAVGGGLATASLMHGNGNVATNAGSTATLEASLLRIDGDIQELKAGLDHTSKLGMSQFNKTTERLDKLERAQAEPAARLAKLSDSIDKLRASPAASPSAAAAPAAPPASKEATGSIASASAQQPVAATATRGDGKSEVKNEAGRLPTLDDWVLRDVGYGSALIDGRRGTFEVYAGDVVPGLGRVDAIRRQEGRWVVVTSRGLIVAR
jgi:hypothetical protein